ncbi:protease modulator HflC [Haematospirillum jordaniae]|uniref:protease modulator HflC n=1 Tax=Haematospirillum jordaniae TaxID=1549855 RepID=UPI0014328544|nr:protease modulator HflC [Haematospirillum jordaniae]NKD85825.1 protease modulator HflC [Haematospirillum jordaniae]
MNNGKLVLGGMAAFVLLLLVSGALFTVRQTQQAIVLQFGNPVRVIQEPGLHAKIPFAQNVILYENRVLELDPPTQELPLIDQKRIIVDTYARYRIVNPLEFYKTVRTESGLRDRLGGILNAAVRDELGESDLADLLTQKRGDVMRRITRAVQVRAPEFGIEIVDVRIGRTDLPQQTSQSVFNRMRSDRVAQAAQLRAEGEELKAKIQAEADRERTVLLAEARRVSEVLRGEGDGERNRILGDAYGRDPEFFRFYRSMEAYRNALGNGGTAMVLSPDSEFLKYFDRSAPAGSSVR